MKKLILTLTVMLFAAQAWAIRPPSLPGEIALQKLKDGNERFATFKMKHPNLSAEHRGRLANGQHPFAVIVSCSDSRIPPELIFDQGLGDIFVIRNAGNVLDEHVLGSINYAIEHLGVNLVVVMGHQFCGAVGAAMKEDKESPLIESIKESIKPAIEKCKENKNLDYDNVIKTNAKMNVDAILDDKELGEYIRKHDVKVLPAYYSISTGKVEFLKK